MSKTNKKISFRKGQADTVELSLSMTNPITFTFKKKVNKISVHSSSQGECGGLNELIFYHYSSSLTLFDAFNVPLYNKNLSLKNILKYYRKS